MFVPVWVVVVGAAAILAIAYRMKRARDAMRFELNSAIHDAAMYKVQNEWNSQIAKNAQAGIGHIREELVETFGPSVYNESTPEAEMLDKIEVVIDRLYSDEASEKDINWNYR